MGNLTPELHHIDNVNDLSFVGSCDCGHIRVDVELREPLISVRNAYILVSLVMMARWHSSAEFPAVQILQDSGKFDNFIHRSAILSHALLFR